MTLALSSASPLARQLVRLGRPQNVIYPGLLAIETAGSRGRWIDGLWCYALLFGLYNLAAGYNNVRDIEIDKHNGAHRNPLISGRLSMRIVRGWLGLNVLIVVLLQLWLAQPTAILCSVTYLALLYAYSSRQLNIQSRGFWGITLLAACYGSIPILLAGIPSGVRDISWLACLQAVLLFPYLLAKDYKDEQGDRLGGKRTPLVQYGPRFVRRAAAATYFVGLIGTLGLLVITHRQVVIVAGICLLLGIGCSIALIHRQKGVAPQPLVRLAQGLLLTLNYVILANLS